MISRYERIVIALVFALLAAAVTLIFAQAQEVTPTTPPTTPPPTSNMNYDTCAGCHKEIFDTWELGPHGQALSDPIFAEAWSNQGKPGACLVCHTTGYDPATGTSKAEGVTCEACHSPIPADHPNDNMPVDKSPDLCGKCHSDPRFATENWKLSIHYQRNMTCSVCHNAHTAGMKTIEGESEMSDASALCANCHKDAMANFPTSKHAAAGVTCVNCHLGFDINAEKASAEDIGEAHKAPDHNFKPTIDTCSKCHTNQMHAPGQAVAAAAIKVEQLGGTPTPEPSPVVTPDETTNNKPTPVSPLGYATIAAMFGLAGGVVLAPLLDRWYRLALKKSEEVKHD
jgi:predicted CXXCH cytochrome family protein